MKKNIKRTAFFLCAIFFAGITFAQEALKSIEEEYYDFLSLQGITERPTLGYRTLSDSVWEIKDNSTNNETANSSDISEIQNEIISHPWQNLNLGTTYTLWENQDKSDNAFLRGVKQGIFLKIYGPEWFNSFNTTAPYGQNDGALWQGRGYNTSLTGGARLEGYGLEVTLRPMVTFSQNLEFDYLPGVYGDPHSYFWAGNIDLVQRYGDNPYWQFDWGDTEIRYTWHTLTVGFGTQSPWLGPAWLNPMLGSNNAGTYPKFDIGLRRQRVVIPGLGWYLGDVEGRVWMGQLTESKYFDRNDVQEKNIITGFYLSFLPAFWQNLTIGATKICLTRWGNNIWKYTNPFYHGNDNDGLGEDQKASIWINILFPSVGFELYGEIGVDDYTWDKIANPFHTMIYTLGTKKTFNIWKQHDILGEFVFEWSNFEASQDFQMEWPYMGYYSHSKISQGYTQNGQIIGAGSGYFGNSQYIGFKVYYPKGNSILYFHRYCPDNNYINEMTVGKAISAHNTPDIYKRYWSHYETYMTIGNETVFFTTKDFIISAKIDLVWIKFQRYIDTEEKTFTCRFCLGAKYNFGK